MNSPATTRGLLRAIGARSLRPCHVPLALWLAATLLYGAGAGALLHETPYVAGAVLAVVWLAATWRGVQLLRAAESDTRAQARNGRRNGKVATGQMTDLGG